MMGRPASSVQRVREARAGLRYRYLGYVTRAWTRTCSPTFKAETAALAFMTCADTGELRAMSPSASASTTESVFMSSDAGASVIGDGLSSTACTILGSSDVLQGAGSVDGTEDVRSGG